MDVLTVFEAGECVVVRLVPEPLLGFLASLDIEFEVMREPINTSSETADLVPAVIVDSRLILPARNEISGLDSPTDTPTERSEL